MITNIISGSATKSRIRIKRCSRKAYFLTTFSTESCLLSLAEQIKCSLLPDLITKKPCRALFLLIFFSWLETKLKWTVRKSIRIGNTKKTVLILWFTARDKMYIWKESSPEVKHTLRIPIINLRHNTYNWNVLSYIWMFWEIFYRQVFSPCEHNVPALILINMIGLETSLIR